MAKQIFRDVNLVVNGVDLTDHLQQVSVPVSADEQDVTAMGAKNKQTLLGIGDGEVTATLFQDFDDGSVDATLAPLQGENEPFEVLVTPKSGVISKNNPARRIKEAILPSFNGISGSVGQAGTADVAFKNVGNDGVERITDPAEL
jgi:hypothetical protein